jgi:CRISPR-associated protein (TIGR02584 family)
MRNVLLVSLGQTPQVVTETLWALAADPRVSEERRFVPDELHLVTTCLGLARATPSLVDPGDRMETLRIKTGIAFPDAQIHVAGESGALEDLRDLEANFGFADRAMALIREVTEDADTRLHVSLAGGRKTMSFFMGYLLSMFGRRQDVLSHVLIAPELERDPEFWWPQDDSGKGRPAIELVEIPFLRLRDRLPGPMLETSFRSAVAAFQSALDADRVMLDDARRVVSVGSGEVRLPEREYAFYRTLVTACVEGWEGCGAGDSGFGWILAQDFQASGDRGAACFMTHYRSIYEREDPYSERPKEFAESLAIAEQSAANPFANIETFRQIKSKTARQFRRQLEDPLVAARVGPRSGEPRKPARWGLALKPGQIVLLNESGRSGKDS